MAKDSNRDSQEENEDDSQRKDVNRSHFDDDDEESEDDDKKDDEKDDDSEDDDEEDDADDVLENEASKKALDAYNKRVGKDYKSWDDVAKAEKEHDKKFADDGRKQDKDKKADDGSKPKSSPSVATEERLLKLENPDAVLVMDELKADAKSTGKTILELWDSATYYKREAKSRAEAKAEEEKAKGNIGNPSKKVGSGKTNYDNVKSDDDVDKLSPAQKAEFLRKRAAAERGN